MLIKMNCANGGGGGSALYAEGTAELSTSGNTSITVADVTTGASFQPKTILFTTKTAGKTYWVTNIYDEDDVNDAGSGKYVEYYSHTATYAKMDLGSTDNYGSLYSVDANGFTCNKVSSSYGNTCTYKAWG